MVDANARTAREAVRDALDEGDADGTVTLHDPTGAADDLIEWLYQDGWMLVRIQTEGVI